MCGSRKTRPSASWRTRPGATPSCGTTFREGSLVPLNTAGINAILDDGNEAVIWVAIGRGPLATDQSSAARVQLASSVAAGVITATGVPYAFTGTPADGATHALLFSAATAGTFYGYD